MVGEMYPNQFLQSWEWGEFQKAFGRGVWRFKIEKDNDLVSAGQAVEHKLAMGKSYLYLPRGPLCAPAAKNHAQEFFKIFKRGLVDISKSSIFLRVEPFDFDFTKFGFKKTRDVQPSRTSILSLEKQEDEILKSMHQKTRYNIRVAERHGVKIRSIQENEFDKFWNLVEATTTRDKFRAHPKDYYKKMIQSLGPDMCEIWLAEYDGKILAANLMIFWGDTAVYLHGASSSEHRNVMAPYLLHWEMIKLAKSRGHKYYDFWGVAPEGEPDHAWAGISRFKRGFGGEEVSYSGTFDFALSGFWYMAYRLRTGR